MSLPFDFYVGNTNLKREKNLNFSFSKNEHGDDILSYQVPGIVPPPRTPVKLYDRTYGYFWGGYTWQPTLDLWDCSVQQCRGNQYTAEDNGWNEEKIFRAGTPLSTMVSNAIAKCSHIYDSGNLPAGLSVQLAEDSPNFGLQSPKGVFEFIEQVSAYLSTAFQWRVAARGQTGLSYLEMEYVDYSPRYRVRLTKNDEFKPIYDSDIIAQVAMITWGNDQYATAGLAGVVPNTAIPPSTDLPNATIPAPIDHSVIPDMRTKRVRGDNNIKTWPEAAAMASYLVERNRKLRPIGFTATIDCNTRITAVPPVVPVLTDNVAHFLVEPWHGIRVLNDLSKWGVYGNVDTFYIIGVSWTEDGKLQLTLGDPVQLDTFRLLSQYDGNKLGTTIGSGVVNQPEHDYNGYPTYGPFFDAVGEYLGNGIDAGIPVFASDSNPTTGAPNHDNEDSQFYLPFGAAVHPHEVADYGTQANFGREADSIGIKGFIRVIPIRTIDWTLDFLPPPGSITIPTQSIEIKFYATYPFTPGITPSFATKLIENAQGGSGTFNPTTEQRSLQQGGKIGIEVTRVGLTNITTGSPIEGSGFVLAIGGRKLFPDLGVLT